MEFAMSIETLKEEILQEAHSEAARIMNPAKKESAKIVAEAKKRVESLRLSRQDELKKTIELIRKQEAGKRELERKKQLLEVRKSLVDDAFSEALNEFQSCDVKKRAAILAALLKLAEREIIVATVTCRKEDASLIKKYQTRPGNIAGGIIAENKDKTLIVDLSYESLFADLREKELQKVNAILFLEK